MDDVVYEEPLTQPASIYRFQNKTDDHMYEVPLPEPKHNVPALKDSRKEVVKIKRFVCILLFLFLLTLCVAVVALSLHFTKGCLCQTPSVQQPEPQLNDACSSEPCRNNGTCISMYPDNYVCSCVVTYYGRNCELALSDTSFLVTYKEPITSVPNGAVITWDDVRYDPGNNYDTSTGAYTAPSDGYYQFIITKSIDTAHSEFFILVDGKSNRYCWSGRGGEHGHTQTSCTANVELQAGQKIQVKQNAGTNVQGLWAGQRINSWFAGQMLYPK